MKTKFQSDLDSSEDATRQESLSQESRKTVGCRKEREKKREWFVKRRTGGFYVRRKREPGWKKVSSVDEADTHVRKERSTLEYSESWIGVVTRME